MVRDFVLLGGNAELPGSHHPEVTQRKASQLLMDPNTNGQGCDGDPELGLRLPEGQLFASCTVFEPCEHRDPRWGQLYRG
jgi:hypothetical protein